VTSRFGNSRHLCAEHISIVLFVSSELASSNSWSFIIFYCRTKDSNRERTYSFTFDRQTTNYKQTLSNMCHGVTYYYFADHCFIEYVCDYVMSTYINGHCPYCLLKRDGATRWTRCDKL